MAEPAVCVLQETATTGTGPLTLGSAVVGYRTLADAVAAGDQYAGDIVPYRVEAVDAAGVPTGDWEVGYGTVGAAGATLERTTVRASSNGGLAVGFAAGTKYVFLTEPDAERVEVAFGWNDAQPKLLGVIPAGRTVRRVAVVMSTPFDAAGGTVSVGDTGDYERLLAAADSDPVAATAVEVAPGVRYAAQTALYLSISPGGGNSAGLGVVTIEYGG